MSDLDPLESFTREARRIVVPPDLNELSRVSHRRRRTSVLAGGAAAAAVIAVVGAGVHIGYDDQSRPVGPTHTGQPTQTSPTIAENRANTIVDSPVSRADSTAMLPDQPLARATVWADNRRGFGNALAVTADGYRHRTVIPLRDGYGQLVSAAGPDSFFVSSNTQGMLVSPLGAVRQVSVSATGEAISDSEYLVTTGTGETIAVDPVTATAHHLLLPANAHGLAYGNASFLWTIAWTASRTQRVHSAIEWSTDGGLTWSAHDLGSRPLGIYTPVPSMPGTMAAWLTGENNDVPDLRHLVVSTDRGVSWHTFDLPPSEMAPAGWVAALPDGRLLAQVLLRGGPDGLLRSPTTDWTHLAPVHPTIDGGPPFSHDMFDGHLTTSTDHGKLILVVSTSGDTALLMSDDGGSTWTGFKAR
jgi:hypothetical protein